MSKFPPVFVINWSDCPEIINITIKIICSEETLYLILESEGLALSWRIEVLVP
jgi:hypothetical protein